VRQRWRPHEAALYGNQMPSNACDAISPSTATKAKLTYSSKRTDPIYVPGPQGEPMSSSINSCTWTFPNPAHGRNGRPNQFSATVQYSVIEPKLANAAELAHTLIFENGIGTRDKTGVTVVREEPAPTPADEGYYVYLTQKTPTGGDASVELVLRRANAVVMVRFSGADLSMDPTLPKGLQLVTAPVDGPREGPPATRRTPVGSVA
jgi:hypothetical protein